MTTGAELDGPTTQARQALDAARSSTEAPDHSWLEPDRTRAEWALAGDALHFVDRLVAAIRPRRVVEFGSGLSTRLLAAACARLPQPATLVSIESDPYFARATTAALEADGALGTTTVVRAHLVVRRWFGRHLGVYDLPDQVVSAEPSQLLVVDGPPLPLGGREGSLLQALHLGEPGSIVLLDDTDRPSERAALARAREVLGDAVDVVHLDGFAKGLSAVVIRAEIAGSAMPETPVPGDGR